MPLEIPELDNRTFEELVTEIRRRVPTATPEWTDLNDSDPGVTLAQLFAFMSEQLLFQVNQVPNKGLVTFLRMLGAELHPATPAIADVTFTPLGAAGGPDRKFELSAATPVQTSGPPPGEKEALAFETLSALTVLNGSLADVVSRDCDLEFVSHRAINETASGTFPPLGKATDASDQFFLCFDLAAVSPPSTEWPEGTFRVRVNVAGSEAVGEPPVQPSLVDIEPRIQWAFASGFSLGIDGEKTLQFTELELAGDSTEELTRSGYLDFAFDSEVVASFIAAPSDVEPEFFQNLYVLRATLLRADAYEDVGAPSLSTLRLNTTPASAVQTIENEALGGSSGQPLQRFQLSSAPVVVGSTVVVIDEVTAGGGTAVTWTEVEDLTSWGPEDRVYQLLPATGDLLFGDGVFGMIPPPDDGSITGGNVKALRYQFGGGFASNVGSGTLTNAIVSGAGLPRFDASNVLPALGGADEEGVDQGVARAPAVVRSRYRAVSTADFEALAKETPDVRVARAFAQAATRPGCNAGMSTGSVTMVLVPFARFEDTVSSPILVPDHVAAGVLRYLDERRLVGTEVFTASADYRQVVVDARIRVGARASVTETRAAALDVLNRFFHPLVGGVDGTGWPFGGTIFFSNVFERLLGVPGVERVDNVLISVDNGPFLECEDVPIGEGSLLYNGQHVVRTSAGG